MRLERGLAERVSCFGERALICSPTCAGLTTSEVRDMGSYGWVSFVPHQGQKAISIDDDPPSWIGNPNPRSVPTITTSGQSEGSAWTSHDQRSCASSWSQQDIARHPGSRLADRDRSAATHYSCAPSWKCTWRVHPGENAATCEAVPWWGFVGRKWPSLTAMS